MELNFKRDFEWEGGGEGGSFDEKAVNFITY